MQRNGGTKTTVRTSNRAVNAAPDYQTNLAKDDMSDLHEGDYVIQGDRGEQWPAPPDEFRRRYRGPVPVYEPPKVPTATREPAGI